MIYWYWFPIKPALKNKKFFLLFLVTSPLLILIRFMGTKCVVPWKEIEGK